jgi:hypothetical protein
VIERGEVRKRARQWIKERNPAVGEGQARWLEEWLTDFALEVLEEYDWLDSEMKE